MFNRKNPRLIPARCRNLFTKTSLNNSRINLEYNIEKIISVFEKKLDWWVIETLYISNFKSLQNPK